MTITEMTSAELADVYRDLHAHPELSHQRGGIDVTKRLLVVAALTLAALTTSCSKEDGPQPARIFTALAAGADHTCAITTDARVMCWGANRDAQLGVKPSGDLEAKAYPVDGVADVKALSVGGDVSCALTNGGAVLCWGEGGKLGSGRPGQSHTPQPVVGLSSGVTQVAVAGWHACALIDDGRIKCWGNNHAFQLGDGTRENRLAPVDVVGLPGPASAVYTNGLSSCAQLVSGGVMCWGQPVFSMRGRDGNRLESQHPDPRTVGQFGDRIAGMSTSGSNSVCFLTESRMARCFGYNQTGILGNGTKMDSEAPTDVEGLGSNVRDIGLGSEHACAVTSSGGVRCWGIVSFTENWGARPEQIMKDREYGPVPEEVPGLDSEVTALTTGSEHMCVLRESGNIQCVGPNVFGQLGNGSTNAGDLPVELQLAKEPVSS